MEKKIDLIFEVDDAIPEKIIGDKVRLNQILMNLIGNALKFTNKGSVNVSCNLLNNNKEFFEINFLIKDTGIGIAADKLDTIFERFEQASLNTARKYGGSGLGLNIAKKLVNLQDSELKVSSEFGLGSEFYFTLKYYKIIDSEDSIEEDSKDTSFINDKINVLVCEDTTLNVILLQKIFANAGYNVEVAENGKVGIEKLKSNKYDIILMDLQMPEMNGFEATDIIRNGMNLSVPIVAMTANNCEIEKQKCITIGMNSYMSKPFKQDDLFATINKFLKPRRTLSSRIGFKSFTCNVEKIALENVRRGRYYKTFGGSKVSELYIKEMNEKINAIKGLNLKNIQSFDINTLREYSGGDEDMEKDLIKNFINESPKNIDSILEYIKEVDFVLIKKLAHKMKPSVIMFGLYNINNCLIQVENYCEARDINSIQANYIYLKTSFKNIVDDIDEYLREKYNSK
jgi:CheY-like chemotaxis protein